MVDIIILIAIGSSLSKEFRNNGKKGAGKYIAGVIFSYMGGFFIGGILSGMTDSFAMMIIGVVAGIGLAIYIYNQGKKEARAYDPNNPYQNPSVYQNYGGQPGDPYQNYNNQNPQGMPYGAPQVGDPYMPPTNGTQQNNVPYPTAPPFNPGQQIPAYPPTPPIMQEYTGDDQQYAPYSPNAVVAEEPVNMVENVEAAIVENVEVTPYITPEKSEETTQS